MPLLAFCVLVAPVAAQPLSLQDVVTVRSIQLTACASGPMLQVVGTGVLPLPRVVAHLTGDPDLDGVPSLVDTCPLNPYCRVRADMEDTDGDGRPSFQDSAPNDPGVFLTGDPFRDAWSATDEITSMVLQFPDPIAIGDAALAQNAALGFYPADALIDAAEASGVDAATIARWRSEYGN